MSFLNAKAFIGKSCSSNLQIFGYGNVQIGCSENLNILNHEISYNQGVVLNEYFYYPFFAVY